MAPMPTLPASELPHVAADTSQQIFTRLAQAGCHPQYVQLPTGDTMLVMSRAKRCQRLYRTLAGHASVPAAHVDVTR